jgi:hypothetical protein
LNVWYLIYFPGTKNALNVPLPRQAWQWKPENMAAVVKEVGENKMPLPIAATRGNDRRSVSLPSTLQKRMD